MVPNKCLICNIENDGKKSEKQEQNIISIFTNPCKDVKLSLKYQMFKKDYSKE